MGGVLAVRWAAAQIERARAVVTFGAPLYRNRGEADAHITGMGRMQALLAGDRPLPRAACAWMCRHRTAASWIAVAYCPDLPVPVARFGVKHTWDTYTGALNGLVRDTGWYDSLTVLTQSRGPRHSHRWSRRHRAGTWARRGAREFPPQHHLLDG